MATLSPKRNAVPLLSGIPLPYRGKVRDTYEIDHGNMLIVSTDGVSIFDVVLNALVPEKGMILTAMSHFWLKFLAKRGIRTHLVAAGADIDTFLPPHLRGNTDLQSRAMVVKRLMMHPVEFIARGYLTGSAFAEYKKTGTVCGHKLFSEFQDGDKLLHILDTPTTKAQEGHDEALDAAVIRKKYPRETEMLFRIFSMVSSFVERRGILLADFKLEFGVLRNEYPIVGDEVATPDSSRFWDRANWLEGKKMVGEHKAPLLLDKQFVRAWGIEQGINDLNPLNPDHVARAHGLVVPHNLIRATTHIYRYIFWRLFGVTIEEYMNRELGVLLPRKKKRVAIIFGSESDIPSVSNILSLLGQCDLSEGIEGTPSVHVISCHRNPIGLDMFATSGCDGADVVIAAGSKAFALPGILDALLCSKGKEIPIIGVALGALGSNALMAAQLSIEELPGQPVIMDEIYGRAYSGHKGFYAALQRIASGELPPAKIRARKPARFHIDIATL